MGCEGLQSLQAKAMMQLHCAAPRDAAATARLCFKWDHHSPEHRARSCLSGQEQGPSVCLCVGTTPHHRSGVSVQACVCVCSLLLPSSELVRLYLCFPFNNAFRACNQAQDVLQCPERSSSNPGAATIMWLRLWGISWRWHLALRAPDLSRLAAPPALGASLLTSDLSFPVCRR